MFETCCCESLAVLHWCQQAEAPQETPSSAAGLRRALLWTLLRASFVTLCQHEGAIKDCADPRCLCWNDCGRQGTQLEVTAFTSTGERKILTHIFRKNGILQCQCLTCPPKQSKLRISTKVIHIIMLVIAEDLLKSWTTLLKSHSPRSSLALSGKSHKPVETRFFLIILRFICAKIPVRCDAELAAPPPRGGISLG